MGEASKIDTRQAQHDQQRQCHDELDSSGGIPLVSRGCAKTEPRSSGTSLSLLVPFFDQNNRRSGSGGAVGISNHLTTQAEQELTHVSISKALVLLPSRR